MCKCSSSRLAYTCVHVCRIAIYMYIRGRFVHCKLRNEKKVRQILTHSDNDNVSSSEIQFLHECGVLLHYPDMKSKLSQLFFLDPEWLCCLMAQIVTVTEVNPLIDEQGVSSTALWESFSLAPSLCPSIPPSLPPPLIMFSLVLSPVLLPPSSYFRSTLSLSSS